MNQDRLERIIGGPWAPLPEGSKYTLEQIQNHRFEKHLSSQERSAARQAAMAILRDYDLVPKKVPPEPVMKVSWLQQIILLALADQDPELGVHSLKSHAVLLQMEERDVRLAARALARKGLATRDYLFDEYNAHIVGSGYVLTAAGKALADEINKKVKT